MVLGINIMGTAEGSVVVRRGKRTECAGIHTRGILSQSHWLGKREGLIFMSFCNQRGSKTGVLRSTVLARIDT